MRRHAIRCLFLGLLLAFADFTAGAEDPEPQPEPAPDAESSDAAPAEEAAAELPPLMCEATELIERIESWSVDCVALWLENLGFAELKQAFMGNKIDGSQLKDLTMEKLADDYGVSDEDQRKKIYYNLKDVLRKDTYAGNTNYYTQMLMWLLPLLGVYKWFSMKYEKQIARYMKRYHKWQEARNPPKPAEPVIDANGQSDWISGVNNDLRVSKDKKPKKTRKVQ